MTYIIFTDYFNEDNKHYVCNCCYYNTSYKHHFKKHLNTQKHKKNAYLRKSVKSVKGVKSKENVENVVNMGQETNYKKKNYECDKKHYKCRCGKTYLHRQSLYYHKKQCVYNENNENKDNKDNKESENNKESKNNKHNKINKENKKNIEGHDIQETQETIDLKYKNELLTLELKYEKEISNLKNTILELTKNKQIFTNSFNNSFNTKNEIKIFLTEQCANAISIQDFIEQLTITIEDLTKAKNNTVQGIYGILERNLKPLSLTTRPVHHIDKDEWFMKDEKEWKEDNGDAIINKSHHKVQQEYLSYCHNNYIPEEQYLEFISNGTKELSDIEREKIKKDIKTNCKLKL